MTKQFADGIDVGAACQLQGSERMPEAVGSEWLSKEKQAGEDKM